MICSSERFPRCFQKGALSSYPPKGEACFLSYAGRDSVSLVRKDTLETKDIVLAHVDGSRYVLHRVIGIDGDNVTLMGDGNRAGHENCRRSDVCGTVKEIIKENGRKVDTDSAWFKFKSGLWLRLLPVRRYLLWIKRKTDRII